jgi:DNA-directed RNA polymerase subunit N (RpoN/RPB10)
MLVPIRCTCGKPIGAYYAVFVAMRKALVKAQAVEISVLPELSGVSYNVECGQILDDLCLFKSCCRQKMLTHVDFSSLN